MWFLCAFETAFNLAGNENIRLAGGYFYNKHYSAAKGIHIALHTVFYNFPCLFTAGNLVYSGLLAFKLLINRKEMAHFIENMAGQLGNICVGVVVSGR